jgi:hypothetical protein
MCLNKEREREREREREIEKRKFVGHPCSHGNTHNPKCKRRER